MPRRKTPNTDAFDDTPEYAPEGVLPRVLKDGEASISVVVQMHNGTLAAEYDITGLGGTILKSSRKPDVLAALVEAEIVKIFGRKYVKKR